MESLRRAIRRVLLGIERFYHWRHRLRPAGDVLMIGRQVYRGPDRMFPDGTRLSPGNLVGTLHFNNARILRIEADHARQAALGFARLMRASLRRLAQQAHADPLFSDLTVFQGLSWLPPHGRSLGFVTQPCPERLNTRWRAAYFRLLVWAFAPAPETRILAGSRPTVFWLTRAQLLQHYADPPEDDEVHAP